jgi:hypothetical protein
MNANVETGAELAEPAEEKLGDRNEALSHLKASRYRTHVRRHEPIPSQAARGAGSSTLRRARK